VVEHSIGNGEVDSSILSGSTISSYRHQRAAERREHFALGVIDPRLRCTQDCAMFYEWPALPSVSIQQISTFSGELYKVFAERL
jgi:hypothetical protein